MIRNRDRHHGEQPAKPAGEGRTDDPAARAEGSAGAGSANEPIEVSEAAADVVKQLTTERDEAIEGRLRALADFRNYQRRVTENEQRAGQAGEARVVRAMLPVLDHFDLALAQNPRQMTVEQLMSAVGIVRDEFNKALGSQGVERIAPVRGEPFDPHRHEAVMRQAAHDVPPNHVVATMQAGYAIGDHVLRPAKVSVSPSADADE